MDVNFMVKKWEAKEGYTSSTDILFHLTDFIFLAFNIKS